MLHLSTQEVVLSIEKSPLLVKEGIVYQEYQDFFVNNILKDFEDLEDLKLVKLEKKIGGYSMQMQHLNLYNLIYSIFHKLPINS